MTRPISVLIVDDHPVVRRGLRVLLEVQDGIEVAGEAGDGTTALALAAEHAPDVILLDLKLPGMDGIAVLNELKASRNPARVLVLTSVTDHAAAAARSRIEASPRPPDGASGANPWPSSDTSRTTWRGALARATRTPDAPACRSALCSASCATR